GGTGVRPSLRASHVSVVERGCIQRLRLSRSRESDNSNAKNPSAGIHVVLFNRLGLGNVFDRQGPRGIGIERRHATAKIHSTGASGWTKNFHHTGRTPL